MKISWALIATYVIFWLWYTPLGGPLTADEIDEHVAMLEARNSSEEAIAQLRAFAESDDGGSFIMVNAIDLKDAIEPLEGCLLYTSPSPRDLSTSRMPSSA